MLIPLSLEHPPGLDSGEPFVPQLDRDARPAAEPRGQLAHPLGLAAFPPAHVHGVAHQDETDPALRDQRRQARQVFADGRALQRGEPLRRDAEFVAHRDSDAPLADVERQDPPGWGILSQFNSIITPAPRGQSMLD